MGGIAMKDYICNECGCCDGSCMCGDSINTMRRFEPPKPAPLRGAGRLLGVVNPQYLPDRSFVNSGRWDTPQIPLAAVDLNHCGVTIMPRESDKTDSALDCFLGYVVIPCLGVLTVSSTLFLIVTVLDSFLWELLEIMRFPIL